jgi:hypothetical protein
MYFYIYLTNPNLVTGYVNIVNFVKFMLDLVNVN